MLSPLIARGRSRTAQGHTESVRSSPDRDMCWSLCSPAFSRALWLSQTHSAMIHPSQELGLKTKISSKQSFPLQVPVNGQEQGCTALPTAGSARWVFLCPARHGEIPSRAAGLQPRAEKTDWREQGYSSFSFLSPPLFFP